MPKITHYYYTFGEVIKALFEDPSRQTVNSMRLGITTAEYDFNKYVNKSCGETSITGGIYSDQHVNEMFVKYFTPKAWKDHVLKIDKEIESVNDEEVLEAVVTLAQTISFVISAGFERYTTLINSYAAEKANLLNAIESETVNRFNDTPQNGGDFTTDDHTTTATVTTTKNEGNTKMARLAEIEQLFKDVYSDWSDDVINAIVYRGV